MESYLADYLRVYKGDLEKLYIWEGNAVHSIPKMRFDIIVCGKNSCEKNLYLRDELHKRIKDGTDKEKIAIANFYIREWGGIKIKAEQIEKFVMDFEDVSEDSDFPFERISSWSKYLCLRYPSWACIYDSRVAYAINAIGYIRNIDFKIFPIPAGRNKTLNTLDIGTLLINNKLIEENCTFPLTGSLEHRSDRKEFRKNIEEHFFISKKRVYSEYCKLMKKTADILWEDEDAAIHRTEMLLFSLADTIIFRDLLLMIREGRGLGQLARQAVT